MTKTKSNASPSHDALRDNGMMRHLLESLEAGHDIGHYGRLVFAMVGRHFMSADELATILSKGQGLDDLQARANAEFRLRVGVSRESARQTMRRINGSAS